MMKALAINASARVGGNTADLLKAVLKPFEEAGIETELAELAKAEVKPCRACWACGGRGNCVHGGDAFQEVFEKMKGADAIVLGSPSYSANVSARMQALLERAAVVCDMNPGLMNGKVGAAVSPARRAGALQAVDTMNHFFLNHGMYVAGSSYWNVGYGQMPGDVRSDEEAMTTMADLGRNMVRLAAALDHE